MVNGNRQNQFISTSSEAQTWGGFGSDYDDMVTRASEARGRARNEMQHERRSLRLECGDPERRTYYVQTYGCPMNVYDSEIISALMEGIGYLPALDMNTAKVVIFNTCCIRDNADQKVYGRLGDFKDRRKSDAQFMLIVTGCLAQKDKQAMLDRFPQVDAVVGTHELRHIPEIVQQVLEKRAQVLCVECPGVKNEDDRRFHSSDPAAAAPVVLPCRGDHMDIPASPQSFFSAKVPISVGCSQWCTYCIVPYVRGPLKSRPLSWIKAEVQRLAAGGWREITLLGQNVNDYGRDIKDENVSFATILNALKGIPGLDRLRFTSPHPAYFTDDVIEAMANNPSVCQHVHLPLQSGDDAMLKKMRRGYTAEQFLALCEKMRNAIPNIGITTDIIAGFSDETEEQFQHTLDVVKAAQFDSAFMFAYSERPGTPGSIFPNQVPVEVRMERLYRLQALQNEISESKHNAHVGEVVEVLVESPSKKDRGRYTGRTRENWLVHFPYERDLSGYLVKVRLLQAFVWGFVGIFEEMVN